MTMRSLRHRTMGRKSLKLVAAGLGVAALVTAGAIVGTTVTAPGKSVPRHVARSAKSASRPAPVDGRTLTAALRNWNANYDVGFTFDGRLENYGNLSPGPLDVFDYDIGSLWKLGINGTGTTIALVEGWNDPSLNSTVAAFDAQLGLPSPSIRTIYPSGDGKLPASCPRAMVRLGSYASCKGWAPEVALDVTAAHLIAPYAKILIAVAPPDSQNVTDDAASNGAPPEMMQAVEYVSAHHLANVISISDVAGESTYSYGYEEITAQDPGELSAAAAGIPLLVGTGDCGAAQRLPERGYVCTSARATAAWDDSPWVTAVGGSIPNLAPTTGERLGPDPLASLEGAGFSAVFRRPAYQDGVSAITHSDMRSVPDLTMDSSDGTSESGPLLAGVLALATQLNGGNVGPINNALYDVLGPQGAKAGIVDVIKGNNSVTSGHEVLVRGFAASKGFDVASGWGTINASVFVPSLVAATRGLDEDRVVREQAARALLRLEHTVALSSHNIAAGGTALMSCGGFLPLHPVKLYIGRREIATLTADTAGSVSFVITPSVLGLKPGMHILKLTSMLLTATTSFRTARN
jgi:subtilase family serine protease